MEIALLALLGLSIITSLGSIGCWIYVVIKMFSDPQIGSVGTGFFGLVCGLYALIWGWQNRDQLGIQTVMNVWAACFGAGIVLNVLSNVIAQA